MRVGLLVALLCGVIASSIAARKGRSGVAWFFIGLLFPLLGVILVVVLPDETLDDMPPSRTRFGPYRTEVKAQSSHVDELERLAALRDRGVLTDTEFEEQKRDVLRRT